VDTRKGDTVVVISEQLFKAKEVIDTTGLVASAKFSELHACVQSLGVMCLPACGAATTSPELDGGVFHCCFSCQITARLRQPLKHGFFTG
jgi:hypothetical protein